MKTYILHVETPSGQIKVFEIPASDHRQARIKGREHGKLRAGPTEKIVLPDKIIRKDNF